MNLVVAAITVFFGFGVMSMAGLGAATLFIPIFYYTGTPLPEAISTGLLLNVVSLAVAVPPHLKARTINLRLGLPILIVAAALAPVGAVVSQSVDTAMLLVLFALFLIASGAMMLFYQRPEKPWHMPMSVELGLGTGVGGGVGFIAGLLGKGGGVFVLPLFHGMGLDPKTAAGTTAVVALASSLSGFAARATLGSLDPVFALVTGVAAAVGTALAHLFVGTRLSSDALKRITAILLWVVAVKILWDAVA